MSVFVDLSGHLVLNVISFEYTTARFREARSASLASTRSARRYGDTAITTVASGQ